METQAVVSALRDLTETIGQLLSGAKAAVKESVEQFIDKKITKLFGVASAYKKVLERFELQTKEEFERKLHQLFRHSEVREAYDDWQDVEKEFTALGSCIVLVSFGIREGAQQWLKDTQCPFPLLLDGQRQLYHMLGLMRSVYKVWSVACMVYYAEQMRAGKTLPSPYENVHDDINQMGGDFVVSKDGKLILSYRSQSSKDRPAVDSLLKTLRNCKTL